MKFSILSQVLAIHYASAYTFPGSYTPPATASVSTEPQSTYPSAPEPPVQPTAEYGNPVWNKDENESPATAPYMQMTTTSAPPAQQQYTPAHYPPNPNAGANWDSEDSSPSTANRKPLANNFIPVNGYADAVRPSHVAKWNEQEAKRNQAHAIASRNTMPDYDAMSINQLRQVAETMGYDGRRSKVDRTGWLMIAKGYGHTVKGAIKVDTAAAANSSMEEAPVLLDAETRWKSNAGARTRAYAEAARNDNPDWDAMSMDQLRQVATTMGYNTRGVDRVGLLMIAKGQGSMVQAKLLQNRDGPQTRGDSTFVDAETRWRANAGARSRAHLGSARNTEPDWDAMSVDQLKRLAIQKGYEVPVRGVDRTGLIMICKGYGNTVVPRPAQQQQQQQPQQGFTGGGSASYLNSFQPPAPAGPTGGTGTSMSQFQAEGLQRIRAQEAAAANRNYDYDAMSMDQLRKVANQMGYCGTGVDRSGLVMIAKG